MSRNKKIVGENSFSVKFDDLSGLAEGTGTEIQNSAEYFEKALHEAKSQNDNESMALAYYGAIISHMNRDKCDRAVEFIEEARNTFGDYLDLHFLELATYNRCAEFTKALEAGHRYLSIRENTDPDLDPHLSQSYDLLSDALWLASEAARRTARFKESIDYQRRSVEINPQNHFRRIVFASNLGKESKIDEAIAALDDGLRLFPREIAFENAKALVFGDADEFDKASEILDNILKNSPRDVDALINYGVISEKKGDYSPAEDYFKKALSIDPAHDVATSNLKRLKETIEDKKQTISLCMIVKNEQHFLPGCLRTVQGLPDEIIVVDTGSTDRTMEIAREFGARIYEHPWQNDFSFHRNQSIDYATGDWILILDADEELDPSEHNMIRSVIRRKDIDAVTFVVYNKIQAGRTGFLNSHRLFRNKKEYRYSGIVHNQLLMDGITLTSQLKVFHHGYGLSEEDMQAKGKRTETLIKKQLEENPENAFAHFNLAQIYRGLSEPELSLKHATRVIEILSPENVDRRHVYVMALDQIGCACVGLNDNEKAKEYFFKALEIKEDYLDPLFNLGYVYSKESDYDKADELFHRFLEVRANFSEHREWIGLILNNLNSQFAVYYGLGLSQYFRNNIDKALEYFHKVIDEVGDFEYTHHLLARCYRRKKEFKKVVYHCEKAIENDHKDAEIYIIIGEAYLNLRNTGKASECFEKSLVFEDARDASLLGAAGAASLEGDYEKAMVLINKALETAPHSPQVLAARGDLLYSSRSFSSAAQTYRDQSRSNPDDPAPWNNLGNCFFKQHNYASAEECYRRSLTISPGFAMGYRNLAVCLLKLNRPDESTAYFEKYLEAIPDDVDAHATLGDIYYNAKDYWKAISQYESFIRQRPDQYNAILRLADCYFNLGKLDSAKAGYRVVLRKDPENPIAARRLNEIERFTNSVVIQ
jgi:tetratricopeptide (TPR) repeat protein